ncbi:MAG TPA: helix-turn-helix transcriptional regulator [Chitinophagaceae bacterium]|jgi:putative transcriptional regulator|nr:helix-turn-helix transcriptional regulator [Chitinophagaceae bacterium]
MRNSVKEERVRHELTQAQLAERVGVSRQTIISIEMNRYTPSVLLALKLAAALKRMVEEVFQLEPGD